MKILQLIAAFLMISNIAISQKPVLDTAALNDRQSFRGIRGAGISDNGDFVYYTFDNSSRRKNIIVQSVKERWQQSFGGVTEIGFTSDNTRFVYQSGDSLCLLNLNTKKIESLPGIKSIGSAKSTFKQSIDWLAWQNKKDSAVLVLRQLSSGHEQRFGRIVEYAFNERGSLLLMKGLDSTHHELFSVLDLATSKTQTIWKSEKGSKVIAYKFDKGNDQLGFMVTSAGKNSIWWYQSGGPGAEMKVDDQSVGIGAGWIVSNSPLNFTKSGKCILFKLEKQEDIQKESQAVNVDLWSYKDVLLPPQQPKILRCQGSVALSDGLITKLCCEWNESLQIAGDIAIIRRVKNPVVDWVANERDKDNYRWVSLVDLRQDNIGTSNIWDDMQCSPDGHWLMFLDRSHMLFYSYELESRKLRLLPGYHGPKVDFGWEGGFRNSSCGWLTDGRMLVDDGYDMWALDPMGKSTVNLTGGLGVSQRVRFRRIKDADWDVPVSPDSILRLSAFDEKSKYNGVYQLIPNKKVPPERLTMGPIYISQRSSWHGDNVWLVLKESVEEAPNYFITHDFRHYETITDLQPQQKYNWMKAELIHFKQTDGKQTDAVLYKPENFDPHKKYPVLFLYYEKIATRMYEYKSASYSYGDINIPWFVSHGYLVCTPDIQYTIGEPGRSACASVEGAAYYLSRLPFVDSLRMGIQGHSHGGYETNYIVTHSHLFKAACTASGVTNLFSFYGSQWNNSLANSYTEQSQLRMGGTPWEKKQQYIDNSPVMAADKVATPLLMMQNKKDEFNFEQGIEFFLDLRRLNKKVWLLQYDNGAHTVSGRDAIDFTIRLTQFFDHYLKGERAPKWMTEGLPVRYKGRLSSFELADAGLKP
ncbi:MAG: prolyl oligopeptidase family serine peptidase [Bacteroidota bacterium]